MNYDGREVGLDLVLQAKGLGRCAENRKDSGRMGQAGAKAGNICRIRRNYKKTKSNKPEVIAIQEVRSQSGQAVNRLFDALV